MLFKNRSRIATAGSLVGLLASFVVAQENQLTPDEAKAGYDLLFNGKDKTGWHGYRLRDDDAPTDWVVATDGPLGTRLENKNARGRKAHMLSNKKYTNFDFKADAKTDVAGNSGLFARYEEVALSSENARSGPEFQVCGSSHNDCKEAKNTFGACYFMIPVSASLRSTWYNPWGQWNQVRIIAFDSNYVHYGNGKKLLEYKIGTPDFLSAYQASKYASDGNNGRYYDIHPGSFLLQDHSTLGQAFRNIKAKELDVHPFLREFKETGKWPETLPQDFVFGSTPSNAAGGDIDLRPEIFVTPAGRGVTVRVPMPHADFQAVGLDGRAMAWRKTAEGVYAIDRRDATGLAIVRLRSEGRAMAKIISLQ